MNAKNTRDNPSTLKLGNESEWPADLGAREVNMTELRVPYKFSTIINIANVPRRGSNKAEDTLSYANPL